MLRGCRESALAAMPKIPLSLPTHHARVASLVFSDSLVLVVSGTMLWGVGMGAQESVVRAAIAAMIPADRRGTAYGMFNAVYGTA